MGKKLFMRTCKSDGSSRNGFVWPTTVGSEVVCPDWDPAEKCGNGLHGLLDGGQDGDLLSWDPDALWMAVDADESDCVDLGGKWKFSRCVVVASGTRKEVTEYMASRGCVGVHGVTLTGGDEATLTGGYGATLTGGDGATLTGGYGATLTGGDEATLTGGYGATLTGGDRATLTGGDRATLTGGDGATLTGGDEATLTGGDEATLTGGYGATLTGGDEATLTGGDRATLTFSHWDNVAGRRRLVVAYVGENGTLPNTAYRLSAQYVPEAVK